MKARVLVGAAVAMLFVGAANAAMMDDFESYANQAAFEATWIPTSPPTSMNLLSGLDHTTGTGKSVNGVAAVNYQYRNYRNLDDLAAYAPTDATPVTFEFWMMLGDPANTGARNYNELRAYEGDGYNQGGLLQLIAMGVYNGAAPTTNWTFRTLYGWTTGTASWTAGSIARSAGWHKLTAILKETTVDYYVDDVLALAETHNKGGVPFDAVVLGSGLTSNGMDALTDDLLVDVVPEPATLALLGLGGLFLRRRR